VDVFVGKLRQKLRSGSPGWTYIHTHFGVGYRFAPAPEGAADSESNAADRADAAVATPTASAEPTVLAR
jgi:DNA-binding winged helix-turn-helix (wHTH) protein